jgi:hypothetical protein
MEEEEVVEIEEAKKKTKGFLKGLKKNALHKQLGVKPGEKIPKGKLAAAANSDNPTLKKRAQFAINAAKWNKKK